MWQGQRWGSESDVSDCTASTQPRVQPAGTERLCGDVLQKERPQFRCLWAVLYSVTMLSAPAMPCFLETLCRVGGESPRAGCRWYRGRTCSWMALGNSTSPLTPPWFFSCFRSLCACLLPPPKQNHRDHPLYPEPHMGPNNYIWWSWNLRGTPDSSTGSTQSYHRTVWQWSSGREFRISPMAWGGGGGGGGGLGGWW